MGGRVIRGNHRVVTTVINDPDAFAVQAQSLGLVVNTFSPMSRGLGDTGYQGDRGYGLNGNRFAGDTPPRLPIGAGATPVVLPSSYNLGIGAMVSGQPGLPNTGNESALTALSWMSGAQMNAGLGG